MRMREIGSAPTGRRPYAIRASSISQKRGAGAPGHSPGRNGASTSDVKLWSAGVVSDGLGVDVERAPVDWSSISVAEM